MSSLRVERVRELLKRALGEIIRREFHLGEAGLVTVNDVDVAGDLQSATVFIGLLGSPEQRQRGVATLSSHRQRIQGLVAREVVLKYTPTLKFVLDDSVVRGNRILSILDELELADPAPPAPAAAPEDPPDADRDLR